MQGYCKQQNESLDFLVTKGCRKTPAPLFFIYTHKGSCTVLCKTYFGAFSHYRSFRCKKAVFKQDFRDDQIKSPMQKSKKNGYFFFFFISFLYVLYKIFRVYLFFIINSSLLFFKRQSSILILLCLHCILVCEKSLALCSPEWNETWYQYNSYTFIPNEK